MPGRSDLALLQQVVDGINEGVMVVDATGRPVLLNTPAQRLLGRDRLTGVPADWLAANDMYRADGTRYEAAELPLVRALRGETVTDAELMWRPPGDADPVVLMCNARPVVLGAGEAPGALTAFRDVTSRRHAERFLLEHMADLQRHAELLDLAHGAVLVRGPDDRIVYGNPEAEELYGWTLDEMSGQVIHDLLDTRFPESAEAVARELLASGHWDGELDHARRDGRRLNVHSRQAVQRDAQDRPIAIIQIDSDVTARTLAEQRARAAQEQLMRLNAELEERVRDRTVELERQTVALQSTNAELEAFSYSVSHDLRAPLRAMNGFTRILLDEYAAELPRGAVRYLNKVRDNAETMGRLVDALLGFSRMQRQEMRHVPVDMTVLARRCAGEVAADPAQATVAVRLEIGELPHCHGDPYLLQQVWANLLGNAVKYSRRAAEPRVVVSGARVDGEAVYSVRDNGVGFDPRYTDKLFKVFQRLHRPDEFEGTGIGLALVERIVARHGGQVWADASPGGGAVFSFALPGSD